MKPQVMRLGWNQESCKNVVKHGKYAITRQVMPLDENQEPCKTFKDIKGNGINQKVMPLGWIQELCKTVLNKKTQQNKRDQATGNAYGLEPGAV